MSINREAGAMAAAPGNRLNGPVAVTLFGWLSFAALGLYHGWAAVTGPGLVDPDALVRLAQIRDFLGGQGWFDLTQQRLDVPNGVAMHWSRIVDLPVGGLILAASFLVERESAEKIALIIWPVLLALGYVGGVVANAVGLAGRKAAFPAVILALLCVHVRHAYAPGNIDHHNLQLVLTLWLAAALMRLDRGLRSGALAALCAALMMSIGMETIGQVALAGIVVALAQTLDPQRFRLGAGAFSWSFAAFSLIAYGLFAVRTGPGVLVCDSLSPPYLAAALVGGGGLGLVNAASWRWAFSLPARLAGIAVVGAAALVAAGVLAPECLAGPYAELDSRLVSRWLVDVDEARPLLSLLALNPALAINAAGTVMSGVLIALLVLTGTPRRDIFAPAVLFAFLAISVAVTLVQIRGTVFAATLSLPYAAWLIARARDHAASRPGIAAQALLIAAWLAPQSLVYEGIGRLLTRLGVVAAPTRALGDDEVKAAAALPAINACFERALYAPLAALPRGRVMATINLGSALLAYTPHGVVGAPYHRQVGGILDSLDTFAGTVQAARAILQRRGITYIVTCRNDSLFVAAQNPDSFAEALAENKLPEWVNLYQTSGPLTIYRLLR